LLLGEGKHSVVEAEGDVSEIARELVVLTQRAAGARRDSLEEDQESPLQLLQTHGKRGQLLFKVDHQ
jgi:hypothetical protein